MSRHKLASSSGESCSAGEAGHWPQHDDGPYDSNIGWTANHKGDYIDLAHTGSFALAINNYNDAAGRDYAPTGTYAAVFGRRVSHRILDLKSPIGASCPAAAPPTATGINDALQRTLGGILNAL